MSTLKNIIGLMIIGIVITGCNQNFVSVKLPSLEKPEWAKHEEDPIAKNAVMPNNKYMFRHISIEKTNKGEPIVDGKILFDPHGKIIKLSAKSATGYITYLVENPDGGTDLKYYDPIKKQEPKVFGTIYRADSGQSFYVHKKTQKKYAFNEYLIGSHGIVLIRNQRNAFMYFSPETNGEPKIVRLPEKRKFEYKLSNYQQGDISYTRHILIKRFVDNSRLLGMKADNEYLYDYSWFNFDTGKITTVYPIYIDGRIGKSVDNIAYDLMYLFDTKEGPICISREQEAYKNIYARNLWTGQKKLLFTRDHGIHGMIVKLQPNGKIKVVAGMGFEDHEIDDVVGYMAGDKRAIIHIQ